MPRYEIAPTRTNLLKLKADLSFAVEGYELLEQKREILVAELKNVMAVAVKAQHRVDASLEQAHRALQQAQLAGGVLGVHSAARAVNTTATVTAHERHVMGVAIPSITFDLNDNPPHYGLALTTAWTDEAARAFREALAAIAELADSRIAVLRLAREIQKTIRRVNALEKIFIPDYEESKKYVEDALEESDREAVSVLKLIKDRLKPAEI